MGSEETCIMYDHTVTLNRCLIENMCPLTRIVERLCDSKFKFFVDEKVCLSNCFGCAKCSAILDPQKQFLEHCSGHLLFPPDDLLIDLC